MSVYVFTFPVEASGLTVSVVDASGNQVNTGSLGAPSPGDVSLSYSTELPTGQYLGIVADDVLQEAQRPTPFVVPGALDVAASFATPVSSYGVVAKYGITSVSANDQLHPVWDYLDEVGAFIEVVPGGDGGDGNQIRFKVAGQYQISVSAAGPSAPSADGTFIVRLSTSGFNDPGYAQPRREVFYSTGQGFASTGQIDRIVNVTPVTLDKTFAPYLTAITNVDISAVEVQVVKLR